MSIYLFLMLILLVTTLYYTYYNDKGLFLFVLLLMASVLYLNESINEYIDIHLKKIVSGPINGLSNIASGVENLIKDKIIQRLNIKENKV